MYLSKELNWTKTSYGIIIINDFLKKYNLTLLYEKKLKTQNHPLLNFKIFLKGRIKYLYIKNWKLKIVTNYNFLVVWKKERKTDTTEHHKCFCHFNKSKKSTLTSAKKKQTFWLWKLFWLEDILPSKQKIWGRLEVKIGLFPGQFAAQTVAFLAGSFLGHIQQFI